MCRQQQACAINEKNKDLMKKIKTLEEMANLLDLNMPSKSEKKTSSQQNNNTKRRRGDAKRSENGKASDKNDDNKNTPAAVRTRTDPITGMKVEVEGHEEVHEIPAPTKGRSIRRLPLIVVQGLNDWERLVNIM